MRRGGLHTLLFGVVLALAPGQLACQDFTTGSPRVTSSSQGSIYQEQSVHWSRKPRIAVMEFDNKSGVYSETRIQRDSVISGDPLGRGMKEQMVTALAQTGAFIVLERQALGDVIAEQDLGQSGRFKTGTTAQIGELEGAELLVYGAVTEYAPSQASLEGGGGIDPIAGVVGSRSMDQAVSVIAEKAITGFFEQDHVALDIRVVDANTGRIVSATSVEGKPKDFGGQVGGVFGTTLAQVGGSYNTPIQKAVRAAIVKAVNFVAETSLQQGLLQSGSPPPGAAPAPPPAPSAASAPGGSAGNLVQDAQSRLNALGYQCGPEDGQMGAGTRACLEAFQRDEGIAVTGRLDAATRERIQALGR
jgi:curli biogenesis system outer membrane secretion channel CsgG